MKRPTILVAEPEHAEGLSTRKLVLETAKFNVLTAHSGEEAQHLLDVFPNVDAVVVHSSVPGLSCNKVVEYVRQKMPQMYVVFLATTDGARCKGVNSVLSSHAPHALLEDMREQFGDPRELGPKEQ